MAQMPHRPIRVLHVVHQLNRGGVETWLLEVLNRLDRREIASDVLVHTDLPGELDGAVRACGAQVLPCLQPHQPWRYMRNFRRIVRTHGPYDIVHCHLQSWCGVIGVLGKWAGIPHRFSHSHNDIRPLLPEMNLATRLYHRTMRTLIRHLTTVNLAVSDHAADSLFGTDRVRLRQPLHMLPAAIDLAAMRCDVDRQAVRESLGLPADALVIGHVGRFSPQKNHAFLIELFAHVAEREPRSYLLLVGHGPLEGAVREQVASLGLSDRVVFAGSRRDMAVLFAGAMDLVLLPSHHEGLPRVALEAQAAGRPLVLSTAITRDVEIVTELVHWLSLQEGPARWGELSAALLHAPPTLSSEQAIQRMGGSAVDTEENVARLRRLYLESAGQPGGATARPGSSRPPGAAS